MTSQQFDDDVMLALLAERERPSPVDEEGKRRVLARVAFSMAGLVATGAATGTTASGMRETVTASGTSLGRAALAKLVAVSVASFAGGAGTHALYTRMVSAPNNPVAQSSSARDVVPARPLPSAVSSPEASIPVVPVSSLPGVAKTSARSKDVDLPALRLRERSLLEAAQAALSRGNAEEALAMASRHATEFPRSDLGEEREAIHIRALAKLGRCADARAAIEHFAHAFPQSLQRASLERLCQEVP